MKPSNSIILITYAAALLTACTSNKGPERGGPGGMEGRQMDPERVERAYSRYVERWDYNEDGFATCDDLMVQRSRLFKRLDSDADGQLNSSEYRYAKFEDKSFMFFNFDRVDGDSSASISVEEFVAVTHSEFQSADKDGNCDISRQEAMIAMRESRMSGEGGGRGESGRGRGGRGGKGGKRGS